MVRFYHQYKQSGMHKLANYYPFFLKYRNNAILRAEAIIKLSPSAMCTNQWAWSVVGGCGTKSALIVCG